MSTKKGRTRCPKCYRRMSKPSRYEWFGHVRGTVLKGSKVNLGGTELSGIKYVEVDGHTQAWQTICLACVREHFADPLLHLRRMKMDSVRLKDDFPNGRSWIPNIRTARTTCPERHSWTPRS